MRSPPSRTLNRQRLSSLFATALMALILASCVGGRLGYRRHYNTPSKSGIYGGGYFRLPLLGGFYPGVEYNYLRFRDSSVHMQGVTVGLPFGSDWRQWQHMVTFHTAFEFGEGPAFNAALCYGLYNTTELAACARWSSRGWYGGDVAAGASLLSIHEPRTWLTGY